MDPSCPVLNFSSVAGFDFQIVERKLEREWQIVYRVEEKIEIAPSLSENSHRIREHLDILFH